MQRNRWSRMGWMLAAGLTLAGVARAEDESLPTARAVAFAEAPVIDGRLNDAVWQKAEPFALTRVMYRENQVPTIKTEVRLGADADYLYIGVRSEFPAGEKILAERTGPKNMDVGQDDHIEMFIRPLEENLYPYYHLLVGAGGARREARVFSTEGRDHEWSIAWRTATQVKDNVWTAEIAIPLYAFSDGQMPAKPMRFNIVNSKMRGGHNTQAEYITWAPVGGKNSHYGFHDPAHFGYLAGLESRAVKAVCATTIIRAANAGLYQEDAGRFSYLVNVLLANQGGAEGKAEVVCEDKLATGALNRTTQSVEIPARGKKEVSVTVPVATPGNRTARVILAADEKQAGALWTGVERMDALTALTAYPNLNYYSGEQEGRLIIGTVFPDALFQANKLALAVAITGPSGNSVLKQEFAATQNQGVVIPLPVGQWQPGTYPVSVELRAAEKAVIATVKSQVRVVPPPPAGIHASKLDHERMCVLNNGKPFFIYSFCSYSYGGAGAKDAFGGDLGEQYARARFNLITSWNLWGIGGDGKSWGPERESRLTNAVARENRAMDAAYKEQGLLVGSRLEGFLIRPVGSTTPAEHALLTNQLPVVVNGLKNNPGLLMYYGIDEPSATPELNVQAALVRELDPYHLQYASCCQYVSASLYQAYDFYFIHHYPGPGQVNGLASLIREGTRTAKLFRVPMICTEQGQRTTFTRELLPQERLAMLVLPVINGAKGIMLWAPDDSATHPVTWRVFAYAGKMFQALAPILVNDPPPQNVLASELSGETTVAMPPLPKPRTLFDPSWEGKFIPVNEAQMPVIQALVQDLPGGGELILVCNSAPNPVAARFVLSSLSSGQVFLRDYFSGQGVSVKDGRFAIDFEPYGVRILETVGSTRQPGAPVALGVAYAKTETEAAARKKPGIKGQAAPGGVYSRADDLAQMAVEEPPPKPGENILKNAGFEEYSLPQMPDHWLTHLYMRGFVGQDETQAHEGKCSVRLVPTRYPNLRQVWWNWEPGQTYTFSVWAKAEKTGSVLRLQASDAGDNLGSALTHDVALTNDWRRYTFTFRAPKKTDANAWDNAGMIGLWSLDPNDTRLKAEVRPTAAGNVWVDAAQLELGEKATDFKPDSYKAPLFDKKWLSDDVFRELEKRKTP